MSASATVSQASGKGATSAKGKAAGPKAKAKVSTRGQGPEIAYRLILDQITNLKLKPGIRIDEPSLVSTLGLSRTPIRQAMQRLATEGFLEILPNRGARVTPLDLEEARSFFEAFETLQAITNHLAARRHDDKALAEIEETHQRYDQAAKALDVPEMIESNRAFHQAIARAGKNTQFERLIADLLVKAIRFKGIWYLQRDTGYFEQIIERSRREHDTILAAIAARQPAEAEKLAYEHVASFRAPLLDYLQMSAAPELRYRFE